MQLRLPWDITIDLQVTPTFTAIGPLCQNSTAPTLPAMSTNATPIAGTWMPAIISTATVGTTTYTFTPTAGCAATATMDITIDLQVAPTFTAIGPLCQNSAAPTLPAMSTNATPIAGTWMPAIISTAVAGTTTYTFTPTAGCAATATMDITIDPQVTPTFTAIGPLCQNSTAPTLPAMSTNATPIAGTWAPAIISTATVGTTTYTFTPTAGCAATATMDITIDPQVTPTFTAIGPLCQNSTAPTLPAMSTNATPIAGTWAPAIISTATVGTTTYTFTPTAGCAATATMDITIDLQVAPTFTAIGPLCQNSTAPTLPAMSTNATPIAGTWAPAIISTATVGTTTYTFTPTAGCAATATMDITIDLQVTPTFTAIGPLCQNSTAPTLPAMSTNATPIAGTWMPAIISTATVGTTTYTFTPTAGCAATATMDITIDLQVTPTFTAIGPLCQNSAAPTLPAMSTNATPIAGTWMPAIISTAVAGTTTYTFTPTAGCAATATMDITIDPQVTPTFTAIGPLCQNSTAPTLPAMSTNATPIAGTWAPAIISTATVGTTTYTFTPTAGCAATATMDITIDLQVAPTFTAIGPLCQNSAAPTLPAMSTNATPIAGTWVPAVISTATVGTITYTFTPNAGICAATTTMDITIDPQVTPTFAVIGPLCQNSAAPTLPAMSTNATPIAGTWAPAVISTTTVGTTTYTFTPNAGICAATTTLDVVITQQVTPTFAAIGPLCQNAIAPTLPAMSTNATPIAGTWTPAVISTTTVGTTTYTFTPNAGVCASTTTLDITIDLEVIPLFAPLNTVCDNDAAVVLPLTSTNLISGTWSPASLDPTGAAGTTITSTFTPNAGVCASTTTISLDVSAISAQVTGAAVCFDNNTPSDPSDDTFTFEVTVTGQNASATWMANDPLSTTGSYGVPTIFGPYPISGGQVNINFTDSAAPSCSNGITVNAPTTCSDACVINAMVSNILCNDNGTVSDPSDDTFTFDVIVNGDNTATGWTANNGTTGTYNTTASFGPFDISLGTQNITITDDNNATCTTIINVDPPMTCSGTCVIGAAVSNILCSDNGSPSDPSDDTFTFEVIVNGSNTGAGWTASDGTFGGYGTSISFGPFDISAGTQNISITDDTEATCLTTINVDPPATCSDACIIDAVVSNILCNDNGTPSDSTDDTFTFDVVVSGSNTAAGWTASNTTVGAYDAIATFGPFDISAGTQNITITDNNDATCATTINVDPPAACSDACIINAIVSNILCNDNGTASDPSDDTFTFDVVVSGSNTAAGWTASNGTTGVYDATVTFGPFDISNGIQNISITDDTDATCATTINVDPPMTCSGTCVIGAAVSNIICDDNGTPSDASDDTFTFEVIVSGSNTAAGWTASNGTTGVYDATVSFGPFDISIGTQNISITDDTEATCTTTINVDPPATCSDACIIDAIVSNILCDDAGTPADPNDDTFSFDVIVSGANTSAGWTASEGSVGAYDVTVNFGPFNISGGAQNITIFDNNDASCSTIINASPPMTCSDACIINGLVSNIQCDDNGTASDPNDDTFTFDVIVSGSNTSAGWTASNGTTGAYDATVTFGPFDISTGTQNISITDDTDATCTTMINVDPPMTCSGTCVIGAAVSNILCDDNGTPSDASDDTFTFEVIVSGSNTGAGWTASNGTTGAYDATISFGPFDISTGAQNILITDDGDASCSTTINVDPPTTCSDDCIIDAIVSNILCDDAGTPADPNDDTFTFDVIVSGSNTAAGWTASDGTVGAYDATVTFGPFDISTGVQNISISDNNDAACTTTINVDPPMTCSGTCVIGAAVSNILCDDNGTPSDTSDDTFTFEVIVSGSNTGASWTASNGTTGNYDGIVIFGAFDISAGTQNITITDDSDATCLTTISVDPPATCSDLCIIDAVVSNVLCDDAGTPSDESDDTFTFDVIVSGSNTAAGWTASDGTVGAYDATVTFGPFDISTGPQNISINDNNNITCATNINVDPPMTCSGTCVIGAAVSNILCDDAGTDSDPADDTFTFEVTVNGTNGATSGWTASDGTTGTYGVATTFSTFNISDGTQTITITDNDDATCTTTINVDPPMTCSGACVITFTEIDSVSCDADSITLAVNAEAINGSTQFEVVNGATSIGIFDYGVGGDVKIPANTVVTLVFSDIVDNSCSQSVDVGPFAPCPCNIIITQGDLLECFDNGTADPNDDFFTVTVNAIADNPGPSNQFVLSIGGVPQDTSEFGVATTFIFPADGSTQTCMFSDLDNPDCFATAGTPVNFTPCSDPCIIDAVVANIVCDDNGTSTDPSDDIFTFEVTVSGTDTSNDWMASDGTMGTYDTPVTFGPFPISGGTQNISIVDSANPDCITIINVDPPATCSDDCIVVIPTFDAIGPLCENSAAPTLSTTSNEGVEGLWMPAVISTTDVGNSIYTFTPNNFDPMFCAEPVTLEVTVDPAVLPTFDPLNTVCDNSAAVVLPTTSTNGITGTWDMASLDPTGLGGSTLTAIFTPDAGCATTTSISLDVSEVSVQIVGTPVCDDNGTDTDPSDDTFTFDVIVVGLNTSTTWTANDGSAGAFGDNVTFGPYPINAGPVTISFSDDAAPNCSDVVTVDPPMTCSDNCTINAVVSNILCDDNGTDTDPSDDTFTFDVIVSGENTSASWTASNGTWMLMTLPLLLDLSLLVMVLKIFLSRMITMQLVQLILV